MKKDMTFTPCMRELKVFGRQREYEIAEAVWGFLRFPEGEKETAALSGKLCRLLEILEEYAISGNAWHGFLALLLMKDENPYSLACERRIGADGTLRRIALEEMKVFVQLFSLNLTQESGGSLGNCLSLLPTYEPVRKGENGEERALGKRAGRLGRELAGCENEEAFLNRLTGFYETYGVGDLGLHRAFHVEMTGDEPRLAPVLNFDSVLLSDLWGYEIQKRQLVENTEAFLMGRGANNVLLYGDSGTGKSTSVKAVLNEYWEKGLRMIAVYKQQFGVLPQVIDMLKRRNYFFILYMDDLSFEEFETEYKYLKAVIEGGLSPKPENVLIYATSNRRHLVRELSADRADMNHYEIHRSDTMQEKLSLADRFGLAINYSNPLQKDYLQIVSHLAALKGLSISREELHSGALAFSVLHGGRSGRVAQQYINELTGKLSGGV